MPKRVMRTQEDANKSADLISPRPCVPLELIDEDGRIYSLNSFAEESTFSVQQLRKQLEWDTRRDRLYWVTWSRDWYRNPQQPTILPREGRSMIFLFSEWDIELSALVITSGRARVLENRGDGGIEMHYVVLRDIRLSNSVS